MVKFFKTFPLVISSVFLSACVTQNYENDNTPVVQNDSTRNDMAMTRISLGLGYLKMGNTAQAKLNLEKAKRFSPDLVQVYTAFAHYYETVGEHELTIEAYENALSIKSDDADTLNNYGVYLCRQDRVDDAEKQFLKAIAVPSYILVSESYENLTECQLKEDNFEKAEFYLNKAILHNPSSAAALFQMIRLQYAMGNYKKARTYEMRFEKATRRFNPQSLALAYKVYYKLGDTKVARNYGAMLVKMFPQSWEAKQYLLNELDTIEADKLAIRYQATIEKSEPAKSKKRVVVLSPNKSNSFSNKSRYSNQNTKKRNVETVKVSPQEKAPEIPEVIKKKRTVVLNDSSNNKVKATNNVETAKNTTTENSAQQESKKIAVPAVEVADTSVQVIEGAAVVAQTVVESETKSVEQLPVPPLANEKLTDDQIVEEQLAEEQLDAVIEELVEDTKITEPPTEQVVVVTEENTSEKKVEELVSQTTDTAPISDSVIDDISVSETALNENTVPLESQEIDIAVQLHENTEVIADSISDDTEKSLNSTTDINETPLSESDAGDQNTDVIQETELALNGDSNNQSYVDESFVEESLIEDSNETVLLSEPTLTDESDIPVVDDKTTLVEDELNQPELDETEVAETVIENSAIEETVIEMAEPEFHTVKKGDNLFSISKKYNIHMKAIRRWNDINEKSLIRIGDKIYISDPTKVTAIDE